MTYITEYNEFHKLYEQEFRLDSKEELARQLAQEYHAKCKAYDRTVCTGGMLHDAIMPSNSHEMFMVHRHAMIIRSDIKLRAQYAGIEWSVVHRYITRL